MKKEPLCDEIAGEGCGLKKVLNIVGGKWKIMILCVIDNNEVARYGDLCKKWGQTPLLVPSTSAKST